MFDAEKLVVLLNNPSATIRTIILKVSKLFDVLQLYVNPSLVATRAMHSHFNVFRYYWLFSCETVNTTNW